LIQKNKECKIEYPKEYWEFVSLDAKELVERMVDKDPKTRLSASEALEHCWLNKEYHSTSALSTAIHNLKKYTATEYFLSGKAYA
jgi:serine/threonine protein kinase